MLPGYQPEDFTLSSFINGGPEEMFTLSSLRGKYVLLIFYPVDFGYVTPTEFYYLDNLMPDFQKANCEVVAIATETSSR
jgi:peroxiredoxin (alkyl hydroperoxide reductase subunit C)